MEIQTPYENFLSILQGGKGVPYGVARRKDGTINHGFKSLKGHLDAVDEIPEAKKDLELTAILKNINASECALFSIGCLSEDVTEQELHRVTGYVEFAINDKNLVNDAIQYFQIFFHFTQRLAHVSFSEGVRFNWELMAATFLDVDCSGFTCSIVVNTFFHDSREAARECWKKALAVLGNHLAEIKDPGFDKIY